MMCQIGTLMEGCNGTTGIEYHRCSNKDLIKTFLVIPHYAHKTGLKCLDYKYYCVVSSFLCRMKHSHTSDNQERHN